MVRMFPNLFQSPVSRQWGWSGFINDDDAAAFNNVQHNYLPTAENGSVAAAASIFGDMLSHHGPFVCRRTHNTHPYGIFYGQNPLDYSFTLLLLEMSLLILISRAFRYLLRPLGQPRVVSDIIGGIIIGPTILGQSKQFRKHVFPDNAVFVLENIGIMGFMYYLFISGVKMDLTIVTKINKKQFFTALTSIMIPLVTISIVSVLFRNSLDEDLCKLSSIGAVASALAITAFPVLYPVLQELNLLSSEVGRNALSISLVSDIIGINAMVVFEAVTQGEVKKMAAIWYTLSIFVIFGLIFGGIRKLMQWIVNSTPEGKPVDQVYVVGILLSVMIIGFITDMFGVAIGNGPLWFGLAIPDGPPLGATLVDRSETIIMDFLMPFAFAFVGLYTDVSLMIEAWSTLAPLFAMVLTGYISKLVVTLLISLYYQMPFRDSLTLSLIVSLRGQVELFLFIHWMDKKIIKLASFTMMVFLTTAVTAIVTPLISIVYDPTRPYIINKRRTIQHSAPNAEVHIIACIHDQESVAGIINLLEISNPTSSSPFMVHALRLINLVGRASPVFIDHAKNENTNLLDDSGGFNTIHNAMKLYQETRPDLVKVHAYTAISPQRSMYQDICEMALVNKATLIIVPFHKEVMDPHGGTEILRRGVQHVNSNVLAHSPCSVAILVDRGPLQSNVVTRSFRRRTAHHFAVLFLGGADAREALAYADRMVGNPNVSLTVFRFLSHNYEGDDEMEKKLDDGVVTWFWVKNEANERVVYREVVVRNGEETVAAIQAMNEMSFDMWIMGRKQGIDPRLLEGLTDWSENHELGVIGDFVACMDFGGLASVLVIQQQVLREGMSSAATVSPTRPRETYFTCDIFH